LEMGKWTMAVQKWKWNHENEKIDTRFQSFKKFQMSGVKKFKNVRCAYTMKMKMFACMILLFFTCCLFLCMCSHSVRIWREKTLAEIICYKNTSCPKSTVLCLEFQNFPTDWGINNTYNYNKPLNLHTIITNLWSNIMEC